MKRSRIALINTVRRSFRYRGNGPPHDCDIIQLTIRRPHSNKKTARIGIGYYEEAMSDLLLIRLLLRPQPQPHPEHDILVWDA